MNLNWISMINEIRNIPITKRNLRQFCLLIGLIFFIVSAYFYYNDNRVSSLYPFGCLFFIAIAVIYPYLVKPIFYLWMIFGIIIGWFMSRIILTGVFFFIMTPIGLIGRLINYQFIELKWDKNKTSYWNERLENNDLDDHMYQY